MTVAITRTAKPGFETEFEKALHDFVQRSFTLPGQLGVHIMRPAPGSNSREYGIIRKFENREALNEFRTSPEYLEWNQLAQNLTEGSGRTEELCGLESWFTLPGAALHPLPKWKMASVTFVGVYLITLILTILMGPAIRNWPLPIRNAAFNLVVVGCLTWLVMPVLTRALHGWLRGNERKPSI
ncbi:MAG: antibiotic biosynthesis monooxygenase [Verrucomicrobiae bacterium]|nr:antibiotic biosynthesis monooxygenase [Verrucomicrobiae bacterium]